jgi:hypothetical protein
MFSSFIPIDNTPRNISPPPIKPIFTNKMQNGKRQRENDSQNNTKKIKN